VIEHTGSPLFEVLKQETLQSVVHDLRAPMTVIKGYVQILLSGTMGQMPLEQKQLLERSVGPIEDLIMMTENLLQASLLEKDTLDIHFAETDLDHLLAETIEFYQLPFKQRHMQIYREGNTLGVKLSIDPFWIKRVLHNLIWNAYKFTPDQGQVTLHVRHKKEGLEISIQDTGRGIPDDKIEKIFDKFEQSVPSADRKIGTGLGLWICKRVMELHDGDIQVQSSPTQGSCFTLSLPHSRIL
jgi:signal transduction histidine kinase